MTHIIFALYCKSINFNFHQDTMLFKLMHFFCKFCAIFAFMSDKKLVIEGMQRSRLHYFCHKNVDKNLM